MTGAMNAAISGMKAHMNKLNVIGNNIANINTVGYKAGQAIFSSALYTTMQGGSNGTSTVGGRNPSQIGYGTQISSIDLDMSSGTYTPTGRGMDCMIDGDGFFLVGDKTVAGVIQADDAESLKALTLTRVGRFKFGPDGYLVDGSGNTVYGFLTSDDNGVTKVSDQLVPIRQPRIRTEPDGSQSIVYPKPNDNTGRLEDNIGDDANNPYPVAQFDSFSIDGTTGKITGTTKDTGEEIVIGYLALGNVTNPDGVTQENGSYYKAGEGCGALTVSIMGGAGKDLGVTHVNGSLANGADLPEGMRIGKALSTSLFTGGLELSKTDLATEISEMITTQRGYQANTRIITVTDSMLEELVNIKR